MESFFRSVFYIDYYEGENRICSVGFLRWKKAKDKHTIEIQIKDIPKVKGNYAFLDNNSKQLFLSLYLEGGVGSYQGQFYECRKEEENYLQMENRNIPLNNLQELVMELENNRELRIQIELPYSEKNVEEIRKLPNADETEKVKKKEIRGSEQEVCNQKEFTKIENRNVEETIEIIKPLPQNKWEQLCMNYPVVHPFKSERAFLSIRPKDFVILQQGYQKLVHNSFLLHGFYNYQHMILGRLSDEEDAPFYVGVPGVYYMREKQAAQMFGFVGFESTENPVQNGSFGYYMIEVEI